MIKVLRALEGLVRRENHLADVAGESNAVGRSARLRQHGITLRRARDVDGAADGEILALVLQNVELFCIDEHAALLVAHKSIVLPAVPEPLHDIDELPGPAVPNAMLRKRSVAKILRFENI